MAPPNVKTSLLPEALAYCREQGDVPYERLLSKAAEDGWAVRLTQRGEPLVHSTGVLVSFDVLLSRSDNSATPERVETVTMNVAPTIGPVSMLARVNAEPTLVHLFFGRLPPQPERPAAPDAGVSERDRQYRPEDDPQNLEREERSVKRLLQDEPEVAVVERRTPDGLPVFKDLYAIGQPGPTVVAAVLDEIADVLPSITSTEALGAIFSSNPDLVDFLKDLADPEQRVDFKRMMDNRKAEIEEMGNVAPRRRSAREVN